MIKIYLLEDQELYLEGLVLLLKKNKNVQVVGYSLYIAEFLEQLPTLEADILLLDVHMPGMEAEEVLSRIRQSHPQ